jgi:hypothetical protein
MMISPTNTMNADLNHGDFDCMILQKCLSQGNLSQHTEATATSSSSEDEVHLPQHVKNSLKEEAYIEDVPIILSYSQDITEDSSVFRTGIPREITVIKEQSADAQFYDEVDLYEKLDELKLLATSFKARVSSNDSLFESLQAELARTKGHANALLEERNTLLHSINDMEEESSSRNEQSSLLRMLLCFALFLYLCGGSAQFLTIAVSVYLGVEIVASIV